MSDQPTQGSEMGSLRGWAGARGNGVTPERGEEIKAVGKQGQTESRRLLLWADFSVARHDCWPNMDTSMSDRAPRRQMGFIVLQFFALIGLIVARFSL